MPVSPTDADLARQALAGSESAFRDLVARYAPVAMSFIGRMVHNRAVAEELVQETFLRVFQRLSSYDPNRRFLSWFLQIAHNIAVDDLRRKRLDSVSLDRLLEQGRAVADERGHPSPAAQAERAAFASSLEAALSALRADHRSALLLYYQQELSVAEIAGILRVPAPTVKTFLHRGRKTLAGRLTEMGWGPTETPTRIDP